uniref:Flagellar biosynthesis protein FlgN n=1 Tax=Ascaris lumbricoides TaxID=6252 RepID=A0A0M3IB85_ASCLU
MIQVVQSVRSEFEKAMVGGADDLAPGYRISMGDSRRLTAIEELIKEQRQLLLSLNAHFVQRDIRMLGRSRSVVFEAGTPGEQRQRVVFVHSRHVDARR